MKSKEGEETDTRKDETKNRDRLLGKVEMQKRLKLREGREAKERSDENKDTKKIVGGNICWRA